MSKGIGKALVTGSTGFIGFELSRQLAARGLRPRLMVRRPHRAALVAGLDAELVQADLRSPESLRRAVKGVDTVFHLGARATFESYRRLHPTHVVGSADLAEAAAAAGVRRFVYASSLFVHGDVDRPIDEDTAPAPALDYGRAKLVAEERIGHVAAEAGMTFAALRLPHVYGSQALLFRHVRRGWVPFPGPRTNRCGHLHVADAARALMAVAETGWSGRSAVADEEPTTWNDFFDVLRHYYPDFRLLPIPRSLAEIGVTLAAPLRALQSRPSLATRGTIVGFNLELPVAPHLVWSDLGMRPSFPTIREGIPAALDDYLHFRWRHPVLDRSG